MRWQRNGNWKRRKWSGAKDALLQRSPGSSPSMATKRFLLTRRGGNQPRQMIMKQEAVVVMRIILMSITAMPTTSIITARIATWRSSEK